MADRGPFAIEVMLDKEIRISTEPPICRAMKAGLARSHKVLVSSIFHCSLGLAEVAESPTIPEPEITNRVDGCLRRPKNLYKVGHRECSLVGNST